MPKLRDRKALTATSKYKDEPEKPGHSARVRWSRAENDALTLAVRRHGTASMESLMAAVPQRSEEQLRLRLRQVRRDGAANLYPLPIDGWMDRISNALPTPKLGRCERLDVAALSIPLILAAREERDQAATHMREDLSDVYEYLAYLVDGKIPPEASQTTSRRLLTLMHHLAALMKSVSLSRHQRWLWCNKRIRRLKDEWLGGSERSQPLPLDATDMSAVPPDLHGAMAGLLTPEQNRLRIPAAFLLSPFSAQVNEAATGEKPGLLSRPLDELLSNAYLHRWDGTAISKKGDGAATDEDTRKAAAAQALASMLSSAKTGSAQTSTDQESTSKASSSQASAGEASRDPPTNEPVPGNPGPPRELPLFAIRELDCSGSEDDCPPPKTPRLEECQANVTTEGERSTSDSAGVTRDATVASDCPSSHGDDPKQVPHGSSKIAQVPDGSSKIPQVPHGFSEVSGGPSKTPSGAWNVTSGSSMVHGRPVPMPPTPLPSLEGSWPGVMSQADTRGEPPFAVRDPGSVRTYSRKRHLPRQ